jgi:hypothetical protein
MNHLDAATIKQRESMVASQYAGILPYYEVFYIQSIIYASSRANIAFERFDELVQKNAPAAQIFAAVQEGLTHAGAVSRFFWPIKKENPVTMARGQRLRNAFGIDDSSTLKWRRLRNAFEHFDEDLDRFLLDDRVGYFFAAPLVDSHSLADESIGNIFKLVDPENGICVLLGEKFEFPPIRSEVLRIFDLATTMDKNGGRLR